jgi:DNA-binding transcriptional LysR family regulator
MESRALYQEPSPWRCPTIIRLAAKSTIKVADLKGHTLLLLEDGHCLRDQALEVCSRIDVREAEDFRATSLETLRQMVIAGLGITLLPEMAVEAPFGSQRGLAIRQFAKPTPSRTVGAVWRKSSTRAAAVGAVCDVIERHEGNGAPRNGEPAKHAERLRPCAQSPFRDAGLNAPRSPQAYADHFTYCPRRTRQNARKESPS